MSRMVVAKVWVQQIDALGKVWTAEFRYMNAGIVTEGRLPKTYKSAGKALDALMKWAQDRRVKVDVSGTEIRVFRDNVSLMHENQHGGKR